MRKSGCPSRERTRMSSPPSSRHADSLGTGPAEGNIPPKMTAAIIEARDLVKCFNGVTAIDHISFAVPEGVVFGFLVPTALARRRRSRC